MTLTIGHEATRRRAHRVYCSDCGERVLVAPLPDGFLTVVLDRREVELRRPCLVCLSARLRDKEQRCWRCGTFPWQYRTLPGGVGWVGEPEGIERDRRLAWSRDGRLVTGLRPSVTPEDLGEPLLLVSAVGRARPYVPGAPRRRVGEALHRPHRCSVRLAG